MSVQGIEEKILAAARAKAQKITDEADAELRAKLEKGRAELRSELEENEISRKKKAKEAMEQEVSSFRLVEKNKTRELKRKIVDSVFSDAKRELSEGKGYRTYLENTLERFSKKGDAIVVPFSQRGLFDGEYKDLVVKYGLSISPEKGSFERGFVLVRNEERLNCTIDELFKTETQEKEIGIARALFE